MRMMKMVKGTWFITVTVGINVFICLFVFDKSHKESTAFLILPYLHAIMVLQFLLVMNFLIDPEP